MKCARGFILVFTLCLISLLSLLVLSSMHQLLLYQRAATQREQQRQHFYQLERLAQQLMDSVQTSFDSCSYQGELVPERFMRVLEQQACRLTFNKKTYYYLIENLGIYPCLMIAESGRLYASQHLRLTVASSLRAGSSRSLLQLRLLQLAPMQSCSGVVSYVRPGVSSWRYIA